jgi:hypothetical protein
MLKLYYVRKKSKEHKKELIAFGEYDTLQGLYDDLYSNHSQCICGTYVIVNDARVWQVKVKFKDYSNYEKIGETEWEVADTYTTA